MIYTALTRKAMAFCYEKHMGSFDKCGVPYVFHPLHVAESMTDEYSTCAALLHDVVEDTETTLSELAEAGFPREVIEAVDLLTHRDDVPYMEYIAALSSNSIARHVKLADLMHNSDPARLMPDTERDTDRLAKYRAAAELLIRSEEKGNA